MIVHINPPRDTIQNGQLGCKTPEHAFKGPWAQFSEGACLSLPILNYRIAPASASQHYYEVTVHSFILPLMIQEAQIALTAQIKMIGDF